MAKSYSNTRIFAYFLGENKRNREIAISYAKRKNMSISFVPYLDLRDRIWEKKNKEFLAPIIGINEFLYGIMSADLVLTDSFHATAFSCIFGTPFFVMPRFFEDDVNSMNSRVKELLYKLNIEYRYTTEIRDSFDWTAEELTKINKEISAMKAKGLDFLKETIEACL